MPIPENMSSEPSNLPEKKKSPILLILIFLLILGIAGGIYFFMSSSSEEVLVEKDMDVTEDLDEIEEDLEKPKLINGVMEVSVEETGSSYDVVSGETEGFFMDGQNADILLGGYDFNNAGGPLMFNHPKGISSDGEHLLLADGNNNRVLVWNSLPTGNEEPDLVLGQPDFYSNDAGDDADQMNWPVSVFVNDGQVVVADTYNHRILVWHEFPTENGQEADFILNGLTSGEISLAVGDLSEANSFYWPWGVWTDGEKLIISSTGTGEVLIWNEFPTEEYQEADIVLVGDLHSFEIGTPRSIASNGEYLIVGDHNAPILENKNCATFVWTDFPTEDNEAHDFCLYDESVDWGWFSGAFAEDGTLALLTSNNIYLWDEYNLPKTSAGETDLSAASSADLILTSNIGPVAGDGNTLTFGGDTLYGSYYNGNNIIAFEDILDSPDEKADFLIGSSDFAINTLVSEYFITNPAIASNGEQLFIGSGYDRMLSFWKNIPDESGAIPDYRYSNIDSIIAIAMDENSAIALAARGGVYIWEELPMNGEEPEELSQIGDIEIKDFFNLAMDENYLYIASNDGNTYVFNRFPEKDDDPVAVIENSGVLSINAGYLVVANAPSVYMYSLDDFDEEPISFELSDDRFSDVLNDLVIRDDHLFVADRGSHRIFIWEDYRHAIAGIEADVILGDTNDDTTGIPKVTQDTLFWPSAVYYDGSYLWVGEYKFSGRILRFSPY